MYLYLFICCVSRIFEILPEKIEIGKKIHQLKEFENKLHILVRYWYGREIDKVNK